MEAIKAYTTYFIAAFTIIAGMGAIFSLRGVEGASDTTAIFAGFVGGAMTFLFNQEVQTRTARQAATSTALGVAIPTPHESPSTSGGVDEGGPQF